ncbi:subunit of formate hydrogenlyase-like membrane complex, related to large subunit of hydrogenase [Azoarcus sp. CIB]|uniref:hydrogenase large subunit n=1 Tax=Aromatoleum sp. (strain CIB) TaxID=198107 RepID=UPI00067E3599|nr:NADH-quinone oxidoreductase subunit C [Azoarcus sp. CIB]AKU13333.1 subunit of formate hydrogenlyase-like membrane complex, related to large subunit of hydrogenase [Azoarcus sp. CIB]
MEFFGLDCRFERIDAPVPIFAARVHAAQWSALALAVAEAKGRLVSLWGSDERAAGDGFAVSAAYASADGLLWAKLGLDAAKPVYPDISRFFPAAIRMQRATRDLVGVEAEDAGDDRPWLRHGAWPADYFPLRLDNTGQERFEAQADAYPFVVVEGDGVHEIPVGPVHAGTIEPGHFRFSVVGEKVLRLEERLGYKHKGIERRFMGVDTDEGARLAGRVSGDSTVAYAWAYAMAAESLVGAKAPERAVWLRALMLERERVANHLGDLGALGNDAAFGFALAQFSRLREDWLRLNRECFGHRLMMDGVRPGGVARDLDADGCAQLRRQVADIAREVAELKDIYDEHAGLQDRLVTTGRVTPELAARLGLTGLAGRASGQAADLRADFPWPPYDGLAVTACTHRNGDVAARVAMRFEECFESLRLIEALIAGLPGGAIHEPVLATRDGVGAGWVEGWRGEVFVALETNAQGRIARCHCHDPSWQNWPVLEHAIIGNIVPDFPLINKSFNLSYSGQDL